jgi:hypothetical protein
VRFLASLVLLTVVAAPGESQRTEPAFITQGAFIALSVPDVDDYEGALKRLRERGVQIAMGPFPANGDQRANVIIRDNSGNLIQLFAK